MRLLASVALLSVACDRRAPTTSAPEVASASAPAAPSASVAPPAAARPTASVAPPATVQRVPVPGDLAASLIAADGPPRQVFLPGLCSSGYWYLRDFPEAARRHGGALAIEGESACGAADSEFRTFTRDPEKQHHRITAALIAAGVSEVPREGLTLIGYSLGGAIAEQLVRRYPERYTRLILIGTPRDPVAASSREARGVVTMACSLDVTSRMKQGAVSIARLGVPATYIEMSGCIHGNLADGERVFDRALGWLDTNARPVREGATGERLTENTPGHLAGYSIWHRGHAWHRLVMPRCGMEKSQKRAGKGRWWS